MKSIHIKKWLLPSGMLLVGLCLGWFFFSSDQPHSQHDKATHQEHEVWTCAMHPQIRQHEPGDCPICGMDLTPLQVSESENANPDAIKVSETAMKLASIQTLRVGEEQVVGNQLQVTGKIEPDERTLKLQTTHIGGRVEQLFVNFTGEFVKKGQVIAKIYSPELITAQKELFEAKRLQGEQPALFTAAKEKLKNWKLTDTQIAQILSQGKPIEQFPILSDYQGVVFAKRTQLGAHLMEGEPLYEVGNLHAVWAMFDLYESDLSRVKVGDVVEFSTNSFPDKAFTGKISFIDPVIDAKTHVAQARVILSNHKKELKPEMLLTGKIELKKKSMRQLVIPKTAILWTGKRSVVYVKHESSEEVSFVLRQVTLGNASGRNYEILSGLDAGEEIAVHGVFSIDAAAQLAGKPSMMNLPASPVALKKNLHKPIIQLIHQYLALKDLLVASDFKKSKQQVNSMLQGLQNVESLGEKEFYEQYLLGIKESLTGFVGTKQLEDGRMSFIAISNAMIQLVEAYEVTDETLYIQKCPMANRNQGASWLSRDESVKNPYFGEQMLTCGSVVKKIQ